MAEADVRRRSRTLLNTLDDGLYHLDADGIVVGANDALLESVGYAREALLGSHVSALHDGDTVERLEDAARTRPESDDKEAPSALDAGLETADGGRVACTLRIRVVEAADGTTEIVGIVRTDEDREKPAKRDSRDATDGSTRVKREGSDDADGRDVCIVLVDDEGTVAWVDDAVVANAACTRDELLGRDAQSIRELLAERSESDRAFAEAKREDVSTNSGLEWQRRPIESDPYAGGRIDVYRCPHDRTLTPGDGERETEFASLVDAVEEYAIFRLDTDGHVVSWNEGAATIKGYEREEILGEHFSVFYTDDDRDSDVPERNLEIAAERGSLEAEGWRRRADGSQFWATVTITPIREDGTLQGYAKVTREMTDRREREQRLQAERDLSNRILETSPIGIAVIDADGTPVRANDHMAEILGRSHETTTSHILEQVDVYDADGTAVPIDERPAIRALETGEAVTDREYRIETDDDTGDTDRQSRWLSINAAPVTGDDGAVRHVVVAATDVTALKRQAKRLERQRDDLRNELDALLERIDDAFYAVDTDWKLTYANEAVAELAGVSRDELLEMTLWEAFPEFADTDFAALDRQAMATGESLEYEQYYQPADVWLQVSVHPSSTGQSVYLNDITQRKAARNSLQQRAHQQEVIAELGQLALETDDLDELLTETSKRVANALGNEYCCVLDLDSETNQLHVRQGVGWEDGTVGTATVSAAGDSQAGYTLRSPEPVVVEDLPSETRFTASPLLTDHDVHSGISTTIGSAADPWGILETHTTDQRSLTVEDVNFVQSVANILTEAIERRESQQELETTIARLEASNERLERFAYAASHDLQEPIRMVSSYLRLIEKRYENALDEEGTEFLTFAVDGADRMREMVDSLLTYSRVDSRETRLEPVAVDEVLEQVCSDLELRIDETDAVVTVGSLPRVRADESQLRQLFQNVLSNAIAYAGSEPPRIHVSAERDGGNWRLSVEDDGIGIDPEHTDGIFEVFVRAHSRSEHDGTGIGLAICQRIVEHYGGDIWLESAPDEGTTVSFTLPAAPESE
ncbi:PAS/PAC sensor signal transduction histidine kinase [Natronolimnohabitans innermongolicus JCM 12255]|uniref:histidine kinase n=2 Tax=Natronolimnohabitans innermongolicus TaxID=253107 RepID=L9WRM5_9EURY|nr:PAS/PAC sensor signal transduction histidine kinase [Natronolimnohabitans innermongolicus JCM 12255]